MTLEWPDQKITKGPTKAELDVALRATLKKRRPTLEFVTAAGVRHRGELMHCPGGTSAGMYVLEISGFFGMVAYYPETQTGEMRPEAD